MNRHKLTLIFLSILILVPFTVGLYCQASEQINTNMSAGQALVDNRFEVCVKLASLEIAAQPKNPNGYAYRSYCQFWLGNLEASQIDINMSLRPEPNDPLALNARAAVRHQLGLVRKAYQDATKSISLDSKNYFAHYNLGGILVDLGEVEDAVASYDRAIRLNEILIF